MNELIGFVLMLIWLFIAAVFIVFTGYVIGLISLQCAYIVTEKINKFFGRKI